MNTSNELMVYVLSGNFKYWYPATNVFLAVEQKRGVDESFELNIQVLNPAMISILAMALGGMTIPWSFTKASEAGRDLVPKAISFLELA
jgi:hypothetical protein